MKKLSCLFLVLCLSAFSVWAGVAPPAAAVDKANAYGITSRTMAVVSSLCNSLVCVQLGDDGEFNIGTSDGRSLSFFYPSAPWSSNIIIAVDGLHYPLELVSRPACDGGATFDSWSNDGTSMVANFTLLGYIHVEVIHTPVLFSATAGAILTRTVVTNNDPTGATHSIGVLYEYDTTVDGDDAAQLYLGPNYVNVETCYDAPFPAAYWDAIPASGSLVGRGTISGGQAVTPDHMAFGSWGAFYAVCWPYTCSGNPYGDSSVLYWWDEQPVPSNGTRTVATYYGVGAQNVAPGNLRITVSQPPLECDRLAGVVPNPFQLLVDVANTGDLPCENVVLTMSNGAGPGGSATITSTNPQVIGTLAGGSHAAMSFTAQLSAVPTGGCVDFQAMVSSSTCDSNLINFCVEVPPCEPLDCRFPYEESDLGDLFRCNYPTTDGNPAHGLSGVAWLGERITGEIHPHIFNADAADDGVFFPDRVWYACREFPVQVTVTAGPNYLRYAACGGQLYLNAWKDGNLDNDFCDELCDGSVSEWIIQDVPVVPGTATYMVWDPGVFDMDLYAGVFRFRLTSHPVGRFGFGLGDLVLCPFCCCPGTFAQDFLGEVEDYYLPDFQLAVMLADFSATSANGVVNLAWNTASENGNDHFAILRDNVLVSTVHSQGNTASGHSYRFTDDQVVSGTSYAYTLIGVETDGSQTILGTRTVAAVGTPVPVITDYALRQNFPNPFNPVTQIAFDLVESGFVMMKVYNPLGQEVATLVNSTLSAGTHTLAFDATGLPTGLYIYRLSVNGYVAERKMLLMK
jgi:hypothetical protein